MLPLSPASLSAVAAYAPATHTQAAEAEHAARGVPAIEAQNLMFFSTIITNGFGSGVVVGTGAAPQNGLP
jgi:hypothetical protein